MASAPSAPSFVLVEAIGDLPLDKAIIPAVLEYVIADISKRNSRSLGGKSKVAIVAVDRPTSEYHHLSRRLSIPSHHIIDGFSQWYPEPKGTDQDAQVTNSSTIRKVHVGSFRSTDEGARELCDVISSTLGPKGDAARVGSIVVLDSLSSVLYISPGLNSVLSLYQSVLNLHGANTVPSSNTVSFISTIMSYREDPAVVASLHKFADTVISVTQYASAPASGGLIKPNRDRISLRIRRRKPSGRAHFENLTARMLWDNSSLSDVQKTSDASLKHLKVDERPDAEDELAEKLNQFGLSFRVGLTSKEKEVRAAAGLPYLHQNEELADSALVLHPESLRVKRAGSGEGEDLYDGALDEYGDSDEEDIFSEDV